MTAMGTGTGSATGTGTGTSTSNTAAGSGPTSALEAVRGLRVSDLQPEMLEHVARFLLEDGSSILVLAATTRAMRGVSLHVVGAASVFELVVISALRRTPGDDIATRIQLVQRALVAGHRADLFTWPHTALHPLPSQLREHACRDGGPVAHSLPLEHNLTVHISNPNDPDAVPFLPVESLVKIPREFEHIAWLPAPL